MPLTTAEMQSLYSDYLKAEGYMPSLDADGDVKFKREGRSYVIAVDAEDPEFFRLVFPAFWEIESPDERRRALAAAEVSNRKSKVAKVFIVKEYAWASIEIFVNKPEDFSGIFPRCVSALLNGVSNYVEAMRASDKS